MKKRYSKKSFRMNEYEIAQIKREVSDEKEVETKNAVSFNEINYNCQPSDKNGKYPMFIRVEYTFDEFSPAHAHLYCPKHKLITKFLITKNPPINPSDIQVMKGKRTVPKVYAELIVDWAKDENKHGINNWIALRNDWTNLVNNFG